MAKIKLSYLIILYAILPIALAVVVFDRYYLDRAILINSPFRPESWLVWSYLFGMSHVVGGMQIFADNEYLRKYGKRLAKIVLACLALPVAIDFLFGGQALFMVFLAMIVYHTIAQQFGLTIVALRKAPDAIFYIWKWSSIGISAIIYAMMYWKPLPLVFVDEAIRSPLLLMAALLMSGAVVSSVLLMWRNRENKLGVFYIFANLSLIATEFYLFSERYYLFVVVISRVIHEFTAWPIYMTHDTNRNASKNKNWIYGLFRNRCPHSILTVLVAFGVGIALTFAISLTPMLTSVLVSLSLYHYYTEHFLWRKESLLREYVSFVR